MTTVPTVQNRLFRLAALQYHRIFSFVFPVDRTAAARQTNLQSISTVLQQILILPYMLCGTVAFVVMGKAFPLFSVFGTVRIYLAVGPNRPSE